MTSFRSIKNDAVQATVKHYTPASRMSVGPLSAMKAIVAEIVRYRSHIKTLFGSDFRNAYRGTVLGLFWNIILPLVPVTVYMFLVLLKVFPQYDGIAPSVYIGFNITVWMLLTGVIQRPINIVKSQNRKAMKTSMPMSAAISSSFAQLCFDTLIRFILLVGLVIWAAQWPQLNLPMLMLALCSSLLFCLSLGLMLAIFNIIYPDVDRVVSIVLQYGLFLSGVIFPVTTLGPLSVLEHTNPFNVFIQAMRDYSFVGTMANTTPLWIWSGLSFIMIFVAVRFFYVMEHRIRELV